MTVVVCVTSTRVQNSRCSRLQTMLNGRRHSNKFPTSRLKCPSLVQRLAVSSY